MDSRLDPICSASQPSSLSRNPHKINKVNTIPRGGDPWRRSMGAIQHYTLLFLRIHQKRPIRRPSCNDGMLSIGKLLLFWKVSGIMESFLWYALTTSYTSLPLSNPFCTLLKCEILLVMHVLNVYTSFNQVEEYNL